jgi:hypothetical protein
MKRSVVVALVSALALAAGLVAYLVLGEGWRAQTQAAAEPSAVEPRRDAPAFLREPDAVAPSSAAPRAAVADAQSASEASVAPSPAPVVETTIRGRFVDHGGAPVAAVHVGLRYPKLDVVADERGRFVLALKVAFHGDSLELHATCDGYGNFEREFAAPEGEVTDLGDLMLAPAGAISGRVVDENGAALAAAEVYATNVDTYVRGQQFHRPWNALAQGASDVRGEFRLTGVPAGAARAWAGGEEKLWVSSEPLDVPEHGEVFDVVLTVRAVSPKDLIRVSVVDPSGAPVPQAELMFHYDAGNSSGSTTTQADEHGRYTFHVEEHVTYSVQAFDPKRALRPSPSTAVMPGTLDLVLQLGENKTLAVVVRDKHSGAPIVGYRCSTPSVDSRVFDPRSTPIGDVHEGGRLELTLPMTPFKVRVDAPGYAIEQLGPFDPDHAPAELSVELSALPGVHGIVTAGGAAARGASVSLHKEVERKRFYVVNGFPARYDDTGPEATSDDQGAFSITLRDAGRYYLRAELEGWAPTDSGPIALDPSVGAKDLSLELVRGGTIEGRAATKLGENQGGILIGASRGDGHATTVRTDADGKFRFTRLTPGHWWVGRHTEEISPNSTSTQSGDRQTDQPEIEWNCSVRDGATTWVDVPAPAEDPVMLHGKLAFGGKAAIAWQVTLSQAKGEPTKPRVADLDGEGRFVTSAAEAGECRLWFNDPTRSGPPMYISATTTLKLGDNEWKLDLPVGVIEGSVSAAARPDASKISWMCVLSDSMTINGALNVDLDGNFVLPHVPAGHVVFQRHAPESGSVLLKELDLASGAKVRVDL